MDAELETHRSGYGWWVDFGYCCIDMESRGVLEAVDWASMDEIRPRRQV